MALSIKNLATFSQSLIYRLPSLPGAGVQQIRNKWADWRMIKDNRKRNTLKQFGAERLRINSIRKNDVLPIELREIADAEIQALPRDSSINKIIARCCITSRPRGVIHRYRVSRIVFRHLADYNKLYGVQRAMW